MVVSFYLLIEILIEDGQHDGVVCSSLVTELLVKLDDHTNGVILVLVKI